MLIQTPLYRSPQSVTTTLCCVLPDFVPTISIFPRTSKPSTISPKTTCLPSSHGDGLMVMKNCEPLVFGPAHRGSPQSERRAGL